MVKYLFLLFLLVCPWSFSVVQANEDWRGADATTAKDTCVYKYLACRDNCDYHQNAEEVRPCKAQCNRTYSCRPKKLQRPSTSLYDSN